MQPTLIITRPAPDGARFAERFPQMPVILSPLQRIDPVEASCAADGVIFTSTNGVAQAKRLGFKSGIAWCVGDRTAQAATDAGFDAQSARGNAEDLLALILDAAPTFPIAHIRGRDARGDIAPRLRAKGIICADCIAYTQTPTPLRDEAVTAIQGGEPTIIPLFSPRAAALLLEQVNLPKSAHIIAISPAVAAVIGHRAIIADRPDGNAMFDATARLCATL